MESFALSLLFNISCKIVPKELDSLYGQFVIIFINIHLNIAIFLSLDDIFPLNLFSFLFLMLKSIIVLRPSNF